MEKISSWHNSIERTTRNVILVSLKSKNAKSVKRTFAPEMKILSAQMKLSLTYDQCKKITKHKLFTKKIKIKVYFAHPGSPWERGINRNTNDLIRQFFPKGTEFGKVSRQKSNMYRIY